jgi:hypothetical protein
MAAHFGPVVLHFLVNLVVRLSMTFSRWFFLCFVVACEYVRCVFGEAAEWAFIWVAVLLLYFVACGPFVGGESDCGEHDTEVSRGYDFADLWPRDVVELLFEAVTVSCKEFFELGDSASAV